MAVPYDAAMTVLQLGTCMMDPHHARAALNHLLIVLAAEFTSSITVHLLFISFANFVLFTISFLTRYFTFFLQLRFRNCYFLRFSALVFSLFFTDFALLFGLISLNLMCHVCFNILLFSSSHCYSPGRSCCYCHVSNRI